MNSPLQLGSSRGSVDPGDLGSVSHGVSAQPVAHASFGGSQGVCMEPL